MEEEEIKEKTQEQINELTKKILGGIDRDLIEGAVQNNNFEFDVNEEKYKVNKPTFAQKQEIGRKKLAKFSQLLQDPDVMFEKDLIEKLKVKNIDITKMDNKIKSIEIKRKNTQYKLGEMIVKKSPDSELRELKSQVLDLTEEQNKVAVEKNTYLEFALEHQLLVYLYTLLTTLITNKKVGDNWEKVWNSLEEFETCENEDLIKKASFYTTLVSSEDYTT